MIADIDGTAAGPDVIRAYERARAMVLGASGFLGRWVARVLSAAGADLTLVVRSAPALVGVMSSWRIVGRVVECDLRDLNVLPTLLSDHSPDVVFNLAGYGVDRSETDEATALAMNRDLVTQLVQALAAQETPARWRGMRLVHAGSALEYGAAGGVLRESGRVAPHTLYGRSKLAGTLALAAEAERSGLRGVTARLFTVFGAGEHRGRLWPSLVEAAKTGAPVSLSAGAQRRDFAYAGDIVEGLLRLGVSDARRGECVNLATGQLHSVREFAEIAAMVLGIAGDRLLFGREPLRPDEMAIEGVDTARLRALTNWAPSGELGACMRRASAFELKVSAFAGPPDVCS